MAVTKFNEKNKTVFAKVESVPGTYETTIAATDALAATTITGSVTFETGNYQYLGDSNSRDEFTYLKDNFADITIETPQQVLGVLDPGATVDDIPLAKYFQACGATVTIDGGTGVVTISNTVVETERLSFNFAKTSSDDNVDEKLYRFYSTLGTVDVSADVGDLPKLKFQFKGNAYEPIRTPIVLGDFGNQTTFVAGIVRLNSIVSAEITPYGENFDDVSTIAGTPSIASTGTTATVTLTTHGLTTGDKVRIRGCTGADGEYYNGDFLIAVVDADTFTYTMNGDPSGAAAGTILVRKDGWSKNFCFSTLQAPNFFGFELTRYLTACEEGYDRKAVASDVNFTMLETHSAKYKATTITHSTITATVTTNTPHGLTTGDSVTIYGATDELYNITTLVTVTGATTFTYVMGSSPAADAVASATEGLIIIDNEDINFDPDANIMAFFALQLKFGTGDGKYITYSWDKVQLANVKDGKVATSEGRDVTLRNTGKSTMIMS